MIPLFKTEGSILTSLKGEVSSFYELIPLDTEGLDISSLEDVFGKLENDLINLDGVIKIYFINGRLYINAFSEFKFSIGKMIEKYDPIETIFGCTSDEVHFYENYMSIGTEFGRILSIKEPPQNIVIGQTHQFPDFVLHLRKKTQQSAKNSLKLKRKMHFSSLFKGIKDIESDAAYSEAEGLLEDVIRSSKALFDLEMFILIKGETKISLDEKTQAFAQYIKNFDGIFLTEERGLSYFFTSLIPGVMPSFRRSFPCESSYLSYLIPFHKDFIHENGVHLHSRLGDKIHLSIFDPKSISFNMLFTGATGEGKSMLANEILDYELRQGTKAFVLDLGNSFKKTAMYHGGEILSEKFNPMRTKDPWYLKNFIMAAVGEEFSRKQQGHLFKCIKEHTAKGINSFNELIKLLEADFEGISSFFAEIEDFFTDEIRPVSDFTYCDLTTYPDAIKAPLIIYLLETFRLIEGKRIFIIDECWGMLEKNAYFVSRCFRTYRKSLGAVIAISQNFDDYYQTEVGRAIIQCSYYKVFFRQKLAVSEFVSPLAQELIGSVASLKGSYSEALLMIDSQLKPIRFYPSPLKYELFTSDGFDKKQQDHYWNEKGCFLPFKTALHNYTSIKYPHWSLENETL